MSSSGTSRGANRNSKTKTSHAPQQIKTHNAANADRDGQIKNQVILLLVN